MDILLLPPELILEICEHMDIPELANLMMTSKTFYNMLHGKIINRYIDVRVAYKYRKLFKFKKIEIRYAVEIYEQILNLDYNDNNSDGVSNLTCEVYEHVTPVIDDFKCLESIKVPYHFRSVCNDDEGNEIEFNIPAHIKIERLPAPPPISVPVITNGLSFNHPIQEIFWPYNILRVMSGMSGLNYSS